MARLTLILVVSSAFGLNACTGSYIYDENNLPISREGTPMVPQEARPGMPQNGNPAHRYRPGAQAAAVAKFVLDPDERFEGNTSYQVLFKDQSFDPFKIQGQADKIALRFLLKTVQQLDAHQEVTVDVFLNFRLQLDDGTLLIGDFRSEAPLSLKRVGYADVIKGNLADVRGKGTLIEIDVHRDASNTLEEAARSPFSGTVRVIEGIETPQLGRLNGFPEWQ